MKRVKTHLVGVVYTIFVKSKLVNINAIKLKKLSKIMIKKKKNFANVKYQIFKRDVYLYLVLKRRKINILLKRQRKIFLNDFFLL